MPSVLWTVASLGLLVSFAHGTQDPTARIDTGLVIGETYSLPNAPDAVNKFLGIPFAISPPERFAAPKRPKKSAKPIIAKERKPACIQQFNYPEEARNATIEVFNNPPVPESEDCLYLNVYTPNKPGPPGGWPVMYWFFGGALQWGSASVLQYDGARLAGYHDVVVVSGNYRTNVFGFSGSPELPVNERNVGFLDQRLALDWVQRNIHSFGGDPNKVTLFGESAGAVSADLHVVMTPENPPFRAAILQSGSAVPKMEDVADWEPLVEGMGCKDTRSPIACLRRKKATDIKEYLERNRLLFAAVVDNVTTAGNIGERRLAGNTAKVPILTGTTAEEARVFLHIDGAGLTIDEFLNTTFPNMPELHAALRALYPRGSPNLETDFDVNAAIFTDMAFNCPGKQVAEDYSTTVKTWRYLFNASFPNYEPFPDAGAFHSSELPLVFGTYNVKGATAQQIALSNSIMSAWTNFAKNPDRGPGWNAVGTFDGLDLGDFGTGGTAGVTVRSGEWIDRACRIFNASP